MNTTTQHKAEQNGCMQRLEGYLSCINVLRSPSPDPRR